MKQLTITTRLTNRDDESFVRYLREISEIKVLTPKEETELTKKASEGDKEAIDELVKRNLRFVVSVAKQYATPQNPVVDLVNEGNIGLIIAAQKFDPTSGYKFISYAVWWVRKLIMEHLTKNGRMIRLPANKVGVLAKLDKQINQLEQKLGRNVSIIEAVESFSLDEETLNTLSSFSDSLDDFEAMSALSSYGMDSLDREIGGDENSMTLLDMVVNDTFESNDHNLLKEELNGEIKQALNSLKFRDRQIMIALFGLDGSFPRTLKDVGDEFGITREMVRQIKQKSLAVLKNKLKGSEILG
jgi:RNA polymerase primary sigma factor